MSEQKPKFRLKRVFITIAVLAPIVTLPMWTKPIWQRWVAETVCVQAESDGTIAKLHGPVCEMDEL
jgi:hypothetical protein